MTDIDRAWLILANARLSHEQLEPLRGSQLAAVEFIAAGGPGLPETARQAILHPDEAAIGQALEWRDAKHHQLMHPDHPDYPDLLREIPGAPILLYVIGDTALLGLPALAIVGSRNPTRGGVHNAFEFSRYLAGSGFCIVSGLAQGVDTAAHRGALAADAATVAVLGHGIDRVYPAANRELAHAIAANGALVSEYALGSPPRKEYFPQRNRLISGLCLGTLVVEAARRSGSLITARLSSEQGREVFAIPGSIHNPLSRGCHQLIREGAKLVENATDIVDELGALTGHLMQNSQQPAPQPAAALPDGEYQTLLEIIGYDPASADELAGRSGLTIAQVSSMLLILELEGIVEAHTGGRYSKLGNQD